MIDFTGVKTLTIPEGVVVKIVKKAGGSVLWEKASEVVTLGSLAVGDSVYMYVDGVAYEWIVVQQGNPDSSIYDSSCDGTWLLMKDIYEQRVWSSTATTYNNSTIHTYLNSTFLNLFDSDIVNAISQVKIPYANKVGYSMTVASGTNGLSTKIFLLSYTEVGFSGNSACPVEGSVLSYFNGADNSKRIATFDSTATAWHLRSRNKSLQNFSYPYVCGVNTNGTYSSAEYGFIRGVRPAMVLPQNVIVKNGGLIDGETYTDDNVTISITQASTASDYCYLQIGDTKHTAVQDITVPSGTKVTFHASSANDLGGISVNEKWLYQTDLVAHEYVYMDATTNMSIAFEMAGKINYIHINTDDGKQYAYDNTTSYIIPPKTMTIDGNSYAFEEGMTWDEWVDSSYNTGYNGSLFTSSTALGIHCLTIENGCDMRYQVAYDDSVQSDADVIVEGREYSFIITNLGPA